MSCGRVYIAEGCFYLGTCERVAFAEEVSGVPECYCTQEDMVKGEVGCYVVGMKGDGTTTYNCITQYSSADEYRLDNTPLSITLGVLFVLCLLTIFFLYMWNREG